MKKTYINLRYDSDAIKEEFLILLHSDNLRINSYQLEEDGYDLYVDSKEVSYFLGDLACYFITVLEREDREYYGHVDSSIDEMFSICLYKKEDDNPTSVTV